MKKTLLLCCAVMLSGCVSVGPFGQPKLTYTGTDGGHRLVQKYPEAYASQSEDGVYDVVLVSSGLKPTEVDGAGSKLVPANSLPVKQMVHFRIFWRPVRGAKPNSPAATNTAIHWYLHGQSEAADQPPVDTLQYEGTGFVRIAAADNNRAFRMRIYSARLAPVGREGSLQDPLGPSDVAGFIKVRNDSEKVKSLLADLPHGSTAVTVAP